MGDRWGPEDPPREAYSRATTPERFEPLIPFAEGLLERLEREFQVTREEGYDLRVSHWSSLKEPSRPSVRLVPAAEDAAPIVVAFSSFPGLLVLAGRWFETALPHCGCDACDETAAGAQAELASLAHTVTEGGMRELVDLPLIGHARLYSEHWQGRGSTGWSLVTRKEARDLIAAAGGKRRFEYAPWPKRTTPS
jgi:hypothetical protein